MADMTASQAKTAADNVNNEYSQIQILIQGQANIGKYFVYLYQDLLSDTITSLESAGFTVSILTGSSIHDPKYKISWE